MNIATRPTAVNNKGFDLFVIIIAIVLLIGAGATEWAVYHHEHQKQLASKVPPIIISVTPASNNTSPVLGVMRDPGTKGYGTAKPTIVFNGGDPLGLISNITWQSWGDAQATGTGSSDYDGASDVAHGTIEQATIVAFNLATCRGRASYNAVEWFFPQHGQTFNPKYYLNSCTGAVVRVIE